MKTVMKQGKEDGLCPAPGGRLGLPGERGPCSLGSECARMLCSASSMHSRIMGRVVTTMARAAQQAGLWLMTEAGQVGNEEMLAKSSCSFPLTPQHLVQPCKVTQGAGRLHSRAFGRARYPQPGSSQGTMFSR